MKIRYALVFAAAALAQEEGTRGIVPADVLQARPAKKPGARAKAVYRPLDAQTVASLRPSESVRQIGVTIWRLRRASTGDEVRLLVQDPAGRTEWTPERVSSASKLRTGDRVRLAVESPEPGYLYVLDRERYANGERSAPYLIFPTTRTRAGDNQVSAGKLVELPAQEDQPNFFSLRPGRPDQVGEELTILLAPKPVEGLTLGPKAIQIDAEVAAKWEREWGSAKTEVFELQGGAGKAWSSAEQDAGSNASRVLTQDDPAPQTVYRVAGAKPGAPMLVKVQLSYGAGK